MAKMRSVTWGPDPEGPREDMTTVWWDNDRCDVSYGIYGYARDLAYRNGLTDVETRPDGNYVWTAP